MSAFSQQLETLNADKPLDQQSTIVSVDKSNLRNWKKADDSTRQLVMPNERVIMKSLVEATTVKKVRLYGNMPILDREVVKPMEIWLSENSKQKLVNIQLQLFPQLEYIRKLALAILESEDQSNIGKRTRSRVGYVLSQIADGEKLAEYEKMGIQLVLKESKILHKTMVRDSDFGAVVKGMINKIDELQEQMEKASFVEETEIVKQVLENVSSDLSSVEGIGEIEGLREDWADFFVLLERKMKDLVEKIDSSRIILEGQRKMIMAMLILLEKIKRVMLLEQLPINKCDLDAEIIVDNLDTEIMAKFDNFVFLSGDGDFAVLYRKLFTLGKKVLVVATETKLAREIRNLENKGILQTHNPAKNPEWWKV